MPPIKIFWICSDNCWPAKYAKTRVVAQVVVS